MEIKSFKKNIDLEKTIKNLPPKTFYIKLGIEKGLFKTITKIFIFNENDVKNYLNDKWHDLLELFNTWIVKYFPYSPLPNVQSAGINDGILLLSNSLVMDSQLNWLLSWNGNPF